MAEVVSEEMAQFIRKLWPVLRPYVADLITQDRPLWRDDGTDIGRGAIIDVTGTVTKSGNVISMTGATATLPNEAYISFGGDPLNAQVYIP